MRLIDADRIVYSWIIDADGEEHDGVTLQSIIHKMPTIDAVEVVRCKDCENWDEHGHWCTIRDSYGWDYTPDDYCSYGVKKDGEAE